MGEKMTLEQVRDGLRKMSTEGEWWSPDGGMTHWTVPLKAWADVIDAHLTQPAQAVDVEPDPALLASMATCLHHGFGMLDASQQRSMLHDMHKLWDEVMGRGYYRPENRERYMAYVHTATLPNANGKEGV